MMTSPVSDSMARSIVSSGWFVAAPWEKTATFYYLSRQLWRRVDEMGLNVEFEVSLCLFFGLFVVLVCDDEHVVWICGCSFGLLDYFDDELIGVD